MGQAPPSTVLSVTVAAEGIAGLCCVVTASCAADPESSERCVSRPAASA